MEKEFGLDTLALHAGHAPDGETLSRAVPLYQTSSYVFRDADHAAALFALSAPGNIYTRLTNPTTEIMEKRLAAMHGAKGAVAASSGMAAIFNTLVALASAGTNIVSSGSLYGGTRVLFGHTIKRFGIEARFVDSSDPANVEKAIDAGTRFVYLESIGNPKGNVDDFEAIAAIAHRRGIPLVVDNTFTPPPVFNPLDFGADILVYSLTKMIGGHGTSIGGATVEKGDFDWKASGKFPEISEPDPTYHGLNFWDAFGGHPDAVAPGTALVTKIRGGVLRDIGACLSPFNAWLFIQGMETLPLRARRHCENANEIARWLKGRPEVEWVEYAGLDCHRDKARAKKYMPLGPGAVFTFGLKGGYEAGKKLIDGVKLFSHLANVLDAKSLVIHPASTTHQQLTAQEQLDCGITPGMVRLSIGLEDVRDLEADLDQAMKAAK